MAERRMFAKTIVLSDAFLDMPTSSRCLYFTLGMFADDEGFVNNPKSIMRQCGATPDDMNVLLAKKFILAFESGVIVIKHWRIHNLIRSDRRHETKYQNEKELLCYDENGAYTLETQINTEVHTICQPSDNQVGDKWETEVRLGKDRIEKINSPLPNKNNVILKQIVDYLNQKTGKNFKAESKTTQRHILARINDGYSLEDFKAVIDIKVKQWLGDPKMSMYLRPETLFAGHFEGYLNETPKKKVVEKPKNTNLEKVVDCPWDDPTPEQEAAFDADREAHKFEDGWRINDDGYWINPEKGIV